MQLDGTNLGSIPDTYRKAQIEYLNSDPGLLHHRAVREHKRRRQAQRREGGQ